MVIVSNREGPRSLLVSISVVAPDYIMTAPVIMVSFPWAKDKMRLCKSTHITEQVNMPNRCL